MSIETDCTLEENGLVPHGQKGVDDRSIGMRLRSRPTLGWIDVVKAALGSRAMTVEAVRHCAKNGKWRSFVHMLMIEFKPLIFALFLCSF